MTGERRLAEGWLQKARSDLSASTLILNGPGPWDTACFHAQQAAEKLLKALLASVGAPIPKTHNLEELLLLCYRAIPDGLPAGLDLTELTPFAVEMRYDFDFWPDQEAAVLALELARRVETLVSELLSARLEKLLDA